jgi:hypothetical protein
MSQPTTPTARVPDEAAPSAVEHGIQLLLDIKHPSHDDA